MNKVNLVKLYILFSNQKKKEEGIQKSIFDDQGLCCFNFESRE